MLTKGIIIDKIKENANAIKAHGISKIGLFGSYAREEQQKDSDIDVLIDFEEGEENFDNFMEICFLLDDLFSGETVEVVTINGLSPYIGPHILKEVEYVQIAN